MDAIDSVDSRSRSDRCKDERTFCTGWKEGACAPGEEVRINDPDIVDSVPGSRPVGDADENSVELRIYDFTNIPADMRYRVNALGHPQREKRQSPLRGCERSSV